MSTLRRRGLLAVLCLAPAAILGARKGDVSLDQKVDAQDVLLLQRAILGQTTLGAEAADAGDVAPLGPPIGDATLDYPDLAVLLRAVSGDDVDGDDLPVWFENQAGTFPFAGDSDADGLADDIEDGDQDGLTNRRELEHRLHPSNPDTDGDGIPDGLEV
ncbi:MAG: hypothetical protein L0206_21355, partial [Actinobacteria bacterium]|nr:hypothetical protein [Actinomycetota bacterium]